MVELVPSMIFYNLRNLKKKKKHEKVGSPDNRLDKLDLKLGPLVEADRVESVTTFSLRQR